MNNFDLDECYEDNSSLQSIDRNMDRLIKILNHRVTKLETSTRWILWIMSYMALLLTTLVGNIVL